jgi:hypothetical protein
LCVALKAFRFPIFKNYSHALSKYRDLFSFDIGIIIDARESFLPNLNIIISKNILKQNDEDEKNEI